MRSSYKESCVLPALKKLVCTFEWLKTLAVHRTILNRWDFFYHFRSVFYVIISALDVVFPLVIAPSHLIPFQHFNKNNHFFQSEPDAFFWDRKKKSNTRREITIHMRVLCCANISSVLHCLRHADTSDEMEYVVVLVWKYEANNDCLIGIYWPVFLAFFLHTQFQESDRKKNMTRWPHNQSHCPLFSMIE